MYKIAFCVCLYATLLSWVQTLLLVYYVSVWTQRLE